MNGDQESTQGIAAMEPLELKVLNKQKKEIRRAMLVEMH